MFPIQGVTIKRKTINFAHEFFFNQRRIQQVGSFFFCADFGLGRLCCAEMSGFVYLKSDKFLCPVSMLARMSAAINTCYIISHRKYMSFLSNAWNFL